MVKVFPAMPMAVRIFTTSQLISAIRSSVDSSQVAQLVFGAGPHACPGARLARRQLTDALTALAPYRPVVRSARADRTSALPSWSSLIVTATR